MFLFALLIAATSPASPPSAGRLDAKLAATVQGLVKLRDSAGGAVGVVRKGRLIYVQGFGMRNVAQRKPVDAQTRFEIGSITKQFTAAAILQLKEQGKLSLNERLAKYLPSFPHAGEITLRQLLNQVSGLPDYVAMNNFVGEMSANHDAMKSIAAYANKPLDFRPGTEWEYSSTNYVVLGHVVEIVSHASYDHYIRAHLFKPAGMTHSAFVSEESKLDDFATPYWLGPAQKGPMQPAPAVPEAWAGGAGAIVSTIGDLAAWDAALAGGKVVNHDDYVLMSSPGHLANGHAYDYGMGLSIDPLDGHRRIWHNGATTGSVTMNAIYPDDHLDIIVLENSVTGDPHSIERAVLETIIPDALANARKPAEGEDLTMRPRILRIIDDVLNARLHRSELTQEMQKFLTVPRQHQFAAYFRRFGPVKNETFKGKYDEKDATLYLYRLEFASAVRDCSITIDKKTNLVSNIGIQPPR